MWNKFCERLKTQINYLETKNTTMSKQYEYIYPSSPSLLAKITKFLIRISGVKNDDKEKAKKMIDADSKSAPIPSSIYRKFEVKETVFEGRPLWTIIPKNKKSEKTVLYLHGGAYVVNIIKPHWQLIEAIIDQTNASFMIPDYPLASQYQCKDVFAYLEQLMPVFHQFRNNRPWTIMGDSAGGGLSYAWSQYLRNENQILPNRIILLSPWLDIRQVNPLQKEIDKHDPMLSIITSRMAGESYLGDVSSTDYKVSPLFGNLENLPLVSIFTGTYDIVNTDSRGLRDALKSKGIAYNFFEYPKMFHVFMAMTFLKEAKNAIRQMSDIINQSGE